MQVTVFNLIKDWWRYLEKEDDFDAIKLQDIVLDDAVSMVQESARLDENSRRNQQNEVLIAENDSGDTRNGQEDKKGQNRFIWRKG